MNDIADHGLALLSKCPSCFDGTEPGPLRLRWGQDGTQAVTVLCTTCRGYMYLCGACGATFDDHPAACPASRRLPGYLRRQPPPGRPRRVDWIACPRQESVSELLDRLDEAISAADPSFCSAIGGQARRQRQR